jgi:predicted 3-demethylubiquinone-9 3-methyltransferase (glyoxalase superfamily)
MSQKIIPNLWFDTEAEEAAEFYLSVFDDSKILSKSHYPEGTDRAGTVLVVEWELNGQRFVGINGGPQFKFDEAVSFMIECEDQAEIDQYWEKLTADGGSDGPCGWCKDKFGLSWQVAPRGMEEIYSGPDKERASRVFQAMQKMRKLDVEELRRAADGVEVG